MTKQGWISTVTSDVLHFAPKTFTWDDPKKIAKELKRSATRSKITKRSKYASAMSMLCYYINRAGSSLPKKQKKILEQAKVELRELYDRN